MVTSSRSRRGPPQRALPVRGTRGGAESGNGNRMDGPLAAGVIAVILKGYPRLSETFIAQELHALEARGVALALFSLRHPTDRGDPSDPRRDPRAGGLPARVPA